MLFDSTRNDVIGYIHLPFPCGVTGSTSVFGADSRGSNPCGGAVQAILHARIPLSYNWQYARLWIWKLRFESLRGSGITILCFHARDAIITCDLQRSHVLTITYCKGRICANVHHVIKYMLSSWGCRTMVSTPVFQTGNAGSIPVIPSKFSVTMHASHIRRIFLVKRRCMI